MSTAVGVIRSALTVPLERQGRDTDDPGFDHRREIAQAIRQMAADLPTSAQLSPSAGSTITGTSYASVSGSPWSWGVTYAARRTLDVDLQLHLQANGSVLHPLDLQVLLDGNQIAEYRISPQRARLLAPHPVPLAETVVALFTASQTVGRGQHTLDLQAKTASGGSWTITADSLLRYTLR